jgi:hypothetical protein
MQTYQARIGGRYFPGDKVQLCFNYGGSVTNGGCEAYMELMKFLNILGDYRLKPNTSVLNWGMPPTAGGILPEFDYTDSIFAYNAYGLPLINDTETAVQQYAGNRPSSMFAISVSFETSNGIEVSGLNAEEQSDVAIQIQWSSPQTTGFILETFIYVDRLWILKPNNNVDLIQ